MRTNTNTATGLLALLVLTPAALARSPQDTLPVTSDVGHFGGSNLPSLSHDGRLVAYSSVGSNGQGDSCLDVLVRDLDTGIVTAITSCDNSGGGAAVQSTNPVLGSDGTFVAYEHLPAPGTAVQIHRADTTGLTQAEIVSLNDSGFLADSGCLSPALSADGSQLAWMTTATNLVTPALAFFNVYNIYVRDVAVGRTKCMSANTSGDPSSDGHSQYPHVSANGRFVAFESVAEDLVATGLDTNGTQDVYVHDRDPDGNGVFDEGNGFITLLSADAAGFAVSQGASKPVQSADGRFVACMTYSSELIGVGTNQFQICVIDRDPDGNGDFYDVPPLPQLVSQSSLGTFANITCFHPSISADGRYVGFSSFAASLVPNDSGGKADAFVFDRLTGQLQRVSVDSYGTQGNGHSLGGYYNEDPTLSGDGTRVAFSSDATNLVGADTNGLEDVFVHELCAPVGYDLGYALPGTGGLIPTLSACGDAGTGGTVNVRLRAAQPSSIALLVYGPVANPTNVLGGTLVPIPWIGSVSFTTDSLGGADLSFPGGGGPADLYAQVGIFDPGAPAGVALSNAYQVLLLP